MNIRNPFPEEGNRQLISRITDWHFTPTQQASRNLIQEGISTKKIFKVGNTGIDSLLLTKMILEKSNKKISYSKSQKSLLKFVKHFPYAVVTIHRRETSRSEIKIICQALKYLIRKQRDLRIVIPVHPNPRVREVIYSELGDQERILLTSPLDYIVFVDLLRNCRLILSDSGGIQEEAAYLGKPILVLRKNTERSEGVTAGISRLVGTNPHKIVNESIKILQQNSKLQKSQLYGDGLSASRVIDKLEKIFD